MDAAPAAPQARAPPGAGRNGGGAPIASRRIALRHFPRGPADAKRTKAERAPRAGANGTPSGFRADLTPPGLRTKAVPPDLRANASPLGLRPADQQPAGRSPLAHRRGSLRDHLDELAAANIVARVDKAPWYIIRPTSSFMGWWDAATSIALILTALVTPFEVSFLEPDGVDGLFVMNRMIDAIFIVDMALQFFLMYQVSDEENDSTGGGRARRQTW